MTLSTRQSLDREHLDIADATAAVIRHHSDGECLKAALERLRTVVGAHFRSERDAMEVIGYPMIAQHLAEHTLIEDALARAAKALPSGKHEAELDFALGLLLAHQTEADRTLFAHLDEWRSGPLPVNHAHEAACSGNAPPSG